MGYKDPEKQREYQRRWIANRRKEYFEGKSCVKCDSIENLELDHIDPSKKLSHNIWSWSAARRNIELEKCQILCAMCHHVKTLESYPEKQHGTYSMACNMRCKCYSCKEYIRTTKAEWRKSNRV